MTVNRVRIIQSFFLTPVTSNHFLDGTTRFMRAEYL